MHATHAYMELMHAWHASGGADLLCDRKVDVLPVLARDDGQHRVAPSHEDIAAAERQVRARQDGPGLDDRRSHLRPLHLVHLHSNALSAPGWLNVPGRLSSVLQGAQGSQEGAHTATHPAGVPVGVSDVLGRLSSVCKGAQGAEEGTQTVTHAVGVQVGVSSDAVTIDQDAEGQQRGGARSHATHRDSCTLRCAKVGAALSGSTWPHSLGTRCPSRAAGYHGPKQQAL